MGEPNYVYQIWRKNPSNGDIYNWFSQLLKIGMEERDGLGRNVAKVTNIFQYDSSPDTSNTYLTLKIKTTYSRGSGQYTFKGKPVLVGSEIKLILDHILVNGTITDLLSTGASPDLHKTVIKATLYKTTWYNPVNNYLNTDGVPPYLAAAIKIGETVYDSQNRPIIKVVDKKISDAQTSISTADGRLVIRTNPLLQDVAYTLELLTTSVSEKEYLLGNIPIIIGQDIPIHTKSASIYPTITSIISNN